MDLPNFNQGLISGQKRTRLSEVSSVGSSYLRVPPNEYVRRRPRARVATSSSTASKSLARAGTVTVKTCRSATPQGLVAKCHDNRCNRCTSGRNLQSHSLTHMHSVQLSSVADRIAASNVHTSTRLIRLTSPAYVLAAETAQKPELVMHVRHFACSEAADKRCSSVMLEPQTCAQSHQFILIKSIAS